MLKQVACLENSWPQKSGFGWAWAIQNLWLLLVYEMVFDLEKKNRKLLGGFERNGGQTCSCRLVGRICRMVRGTCQYLVQCMGRQAFRRVYRLWYLVRAEDHIAVYLLLAQSLP